MDLTNNEIDNINERHTKLRQEHEKLKGEVETQNKYNADNQESVDKALKKLNEEKNIINSDIDMIRNDIRTNENSRKNQDSIFTNKLDQLKQKQSGKFFFITVLQFYFTVGNLLWLNWRRDLLIPSLLFTITYRTWRNDSEAGVGNKN